MRRVTVLLALGLVVTVLSCGDSGTGGGKSKYNYDTDYAAIQAILDANGITNMIPTQVAEFLTTSAGYRATRLHLYPSHNGGSVLDTLPPVVGNLTALEYMRVDSSRIRSLPSTIGNLSRLTTLLVTNDSLTRLPTQVTSLRQLEKLWVSGNQIAALPVGIGNLNVLRDIDVSSNRLTTLPDELIQCDSLHSLNANIAFDNNNICALSDAMVAFLASMGITNWRSPSCPPQ
jgi:hypothetical protein